MTENPKKYVFVGTSGQRGDLGFTAVGQLCSLLDKDYADCVLGGLALIPKAAYDSFGFTQEEVSKWGQNGSHSRGNEEFMTKLRGARQEYKKIRAEISAGKSVRAVVRSAASGVSEDATVPPSSEKPGKRSLSDA